MCNSQDERDEELTALSAIYPELSRDVNDESLAYLELSVAPLQPLLVRFIPFEATPTTTIDAYTGAAVRGAAYVERDVQLSHLPPINLRITLPEDYPTSSPPKVELTAQRGWLPQAKLSELEGEVSSLWEEYGHCPILFAYIDLVQQAAERGFDLDQSPDGCLVLPTTAEDDLVLYNTATAQAIFDAGTFDCGICLEPKKGSLCYKLEKCGDVFCRPCLQDFYNNAIKEGDVTGIRCLSPECGNQANTANNRKRKRKSDCTLHPRELLAVGVEESMVRRYVEMKRKKKLETDKDTVYCPRTWCQNPARSSKYPPIPANLSAYVDAASSSEEESDAETLAQSHTEPSFQKSEKNKRLPDPSDRLAICEKCSLAFCKVCFMGWHGQFARCFPRDHNELSAEEKASYEYIRMNTSPCPYCSSPTQKTMGCNHMICFQCNTHFCYLCGSWLNGDNPYPHYNKSGSSCFQRLWELEEGDEGQGPQDGRGFAGVRAWEQLAIGAARDAEAQEAAAAAQMEEDERAARRREEQQRRPNGANDVPLVVGMAQIQLDDEEVLGRQQRNPFPAYPPGRGAANAVRDHERNRGGQNAIAARGGGGAARRRPAPNNDERRQLELQRFLDMAQRDEEDGWDSDELGDDDERFVHFA